MDPSRSPTDGRPDRATLGDLLYADRTGTPGREREWIALVRSMAGGDQLALHALYERTHRIAYTLSLRITGRPRTAADVTVDALHAVWRRAGEFDPEGGSVLGWITHEARSRAIDRLRFERRNTSTVAESAPPDVVAFGERCREFRDALAVLEPVERRAIETAFFSELTYSETATRLDQPLSTVRTRIRSGLAKLRTVARTRTEDAEASERRCDRSEQLTEYVLGSLPPSEVPSLEGHVCGCAECWQELATLRSIVDSFVAWPTDVLRPSIPLWGRLAQRIAAETGAEQVMPSPSRWAAASEWKEVSPGISCKLLAADMERHRVSMLVRLAPGVDYPPHRHLGVEELLLLDGELWIDERKLHPGDYNRAEPGTADSRVWSETGCTCALITSTRDEIR